jgi:hypothetical protein
MATELFMECSASIVSPMPVKITNPTNCIGLTSASFVGRIANSPGGVVYAVAAASPTAITLQYTEPCLFGALGFYNGLMTVTGISVVAVTKGGSIFTGSGVLRAPYTWTRVGAFLLITTGKLNPLIDPKKGSMTTLTWATGFAVDTPGIGGLGIGVLIPTGVPNLINCPGTPLTVEVFADIVMG